MGTFWYSPSEDKSTKSLHVCVVGAGASGLVVIKELLDEGHTVVCYEKEDKEGGLFYYRPDKGGVYDSTRLTISNNFMAFSSFPPRDFETPHYWGHAEYADYLNQFAKHFSILQHIKFSSEVTSIRKVNGDKFEVEFKSGNGHGKRTELFDAIAVCVGAHQVPNIPAFPGLNKFKGKIHHTYNYKNPDPFRGKNVLCIGAGETAADVVHEIAEVADTCTLSLRHYPSIVCRYPRNKPFTNDAYTSRMLYTIPRDELTERFILRESRINIKNPNIDPIRKVMAKWHLHSNDFFRQFLTKSDVFLEDIANGKVPVNVSGIKEFTENQVMFNDGDMVAIDTIVCNTGFIDDFSIVKDVKIPHIRLLYKHVFHPDLGPRVAFIGFARPAQGGVPACSEMQARYFALLCSGKLIFPPKDKLRKLIIKEGKAEDNYFDHSSSLKTVVPYMDYMDSMAKLIGCKPNAFSLLTSPVILYKYWFGSLVSNQYRLRGPHADPDAAKKVIRSISVPWGFRDIIRFSMWDIYYKVKSLFVRQGPYV